MKNSLTHHLIIGVLVVLASMLTASAQSPGAVDNTPIKTTEIRTDAMESLSLGTNSLIFSAAGKRYIYVPGELNSQTGAPAYLLLLMSELRHAQSITFVPILSANPNILTPVTHLTLNYNSLK